MTLNALLASAESVFGAQILRDRAHVMALKAAPVDLKMNVNHFSFSVSVGELNPS